MSKANFTIRAIVGEGDNARTVEFQGRPAWLLRKLIEAGKRGITTAELPAGLRVSHYIFILRTRHAIGIETERESHSGPFAGSHAIYRLRSAVQIIDDLEAAA